MTDAGGRDVLTLFREEAEEHIAALSKAALALETRPDDTTVVEDMLRRAHSLKGAAKLVGAPALERLTHALETILAEVRAGRLMPEPPVVDALLSSIDAMQSGIERLAQGDSEASDEEVVGTLLALASSAFGLDERLAAVFPGLDREIQEVLTEFQKSQCLLAHEAGKSCWEAELEAPDAEFATRIDQAHDALKAIAEVVSLAGLSPAATGRMRFKFLIATRHTDVQVQDLARSLDVRMTNPAQAGASAPPAEPSAEEAAFAEEMAKLAEQYVVEAADEVAEAATLVLALEASPDDTAVLNTLFRTAHSLKGSGMTYGLPAVSDVAHHMETVLEAVRSRRVTASVRVTNALLQGLDALKGLLVDARAGSPPPAGPLPVLRVLDEALVSAPPDAPGPSPAPAALVPRVSTPGESIRVRLDKLDDLVNLAGEMTVSRSTREAAVQEIESQADSSKAAHRHWRRLRERLQLDPPVLASLREHGLLDEYERLGHRLADLSEGLEGLWNQFSATTLYADTATDAMQQAVMRIRMVPVSSLFDTAPRMIRDLTADKTKAVTLNVSGGDTELDKRVLEMMADPIMHLLRNAVDHGLEPTADRQAAGKPATGTIALAAEHQGSHIVITVRDDGRGMDPQALIASAIAKGVVSERDAAQLSVEQAFALIFQPGFSTKDRVTAISGRGVGMDVVKSNVERMKGRIAIDSVVGHGTTFRIHLPLSISVIQVIIVEAGGRSFCLPTTAIAEIIRVSDDDVQRQDGKPCIRYGDHAVPLVRLADLLGLPDSRRPLADGAVAIVQGIEATMAFSLDRAVEEQTVVVKEIGRLMSRVPHVMGATVLSDGGVAVILDTVSLMSAAMRHDGAWAPIAPQAAQAPLRKTLLVVDDSLSTRELLRGLLESAGFAVVVANHGRQAWELLQGQTPVALVVSDVSMPEMTGYELTARIKGDRRLSKVPVVLVTSLDRPEERLKGMQAGADAYIVKGAFDQAGLLGRVQELVGSHD